MAPQIKTQVVKINVDVLIEFLEYYIGGIYEDGLEAYIDAVKMVGYEAEFTIKKD